MKRSVTVQIGGQRYPLRSDADDAHLKALVAFVDTRFRDIQRSARMPDTQSVAVLTALQVADELFALRQELAQHKKRESDLRKKVRDRTQSLLDYLEKVARI